MERVAEHHFRLDFFLAIFGLILLSIFWLDRRFNEGRFWSVITKTQNSLENRANDSGQWVEIKNLGFKFKISPDRLAEKCGSPDEEVLIYVKDLKGNRSLCDDDKVKPTLTISQKKNLKEELGYFKSDPEVKERNEKIYGQPAKHLTSPNLDLYLFEKNKILYILRDPRLILDFKYQ